MPHLDLDAFVREQQADPLTITYAGRTFTAPNEIPIAALAMAGDLHGEDLESSDAQRMIPQVITMLLGKDAWEHMSANGIGLVAAMKIINALLEHMDLGALDGGGEDPKAKAARAVSRSRSASKTPSRSGDSSRPTTAGTITLVPTSSTDSESDVSEAI